MIDHNFLLVILGFVLDSIIGDPQTNVHPIRLLGGFIQKIENIFYPLRFSKKISGLLLVVASIAVALGIGLGIEKIFFSLGTLWGNLWDIFIFYIGLAFRSLIDAGRTIARALQNGNLEEARRHLSFIVSRDTQGLPKKNIVRGTIESLSENLNDAIIAPFLYAFIFGIGGIIGYKTINTLDSMVGYKTDRYLQFGWAAAKLDDAVNFIPARITFLFILIASFILRYDTKECWKTVWRSSQSGQSPNGGIGICSFAGALGLQLGGKNYIHGEEVHTPLVGEDKNPLEIKSIQKSIILIVVSTFVAFDLLLLATKFI